MRPATSLGSKAVYTRVCIHGEVGRVSRTAHSQARVRPPLSTETASGEGDRLLYLSNLRRVEGKSRTLALSCWEPQLLPGM